MQFLIESFYKAILLVFHLDPEVYQIVWTSIYISFWSTILSASIGIPLGALLALKTFRGKSAVVLLLNTSMALPTVVIGLFCYALLSRMGPLGDFGFLFTPTGMIFGLFILAAPIATNLTVAAIQSLDKRLMLTCKLLGATPVQEFFLIVKEARFAVMAAVVIAFGRVISEVGIAMMLGGNIRGLTRTMTTAIALETSKGEFELGLALGFILMSVAFAINGVIFAIQRGRG
ncbi:MAG: ABC transporter permease [Deltaproteobacteria bacterium]|nr:ABC transporter permease [Deltaproteobacteria bacterium]